MSRFQMLTPTDPEWARMWESLFELTRSYTDHNPDSSEFWQYTGTFWKGRPAIWFAPANQRACPSVQASRSRVQRLTDSRNQPLLRSRRSRSRR